MKQLVEDGNYGSLNEQRIKKIIERFFYEDGALYYKSNELNVAHRKCISREELISKIAEEHSIDHRGPETIYESLRCSYYPIIRKTVLQLLRQTLECEYCARQNPLPKTTLVRRTIKATYPNSRWQMDLKKLPASRGFQYVCNIVDCHSRFAMGGAIRAKSAKEVCRVILSAMYLYGPPRILQTDNGKELNNGDLSALMDEMRAQKINGRPYHPQSQGRVERFNQTLAQFLRRDLLEDKNWPDRLPLFYYSYNNRVHRSLHGKTPYEMYFQRPNFSLFREQERCNLTTNEQDFLQCQGNLNLADEANDDDEVDDEDVPLGQQEPQPTAPETGAAYPLELAWTPEEFPFEHAVGDVVYYKKAVNLGGAAGTAALMTQWHRGSVAALRRENFFRLYDIVDTDDSPVGSFAGSHVRNAPTQASIEARDREGRSTSTASRNQTK